MSLLKEIKHENDIKKLPEESMDELASEIRSFIIEKVSEHGGHLAANLGVVELTMALHRCMDFPEDKLIFDVGHQAYTHKILTGRRKDFDSLRELEGLSGFPKRRENPCDAFDTGHSSTSISAAVGLAAARDLRGTNEKICAVIGDGSMTGGMVYEACNQLSQLKSNLVIILNDNEMSIDRNVGGVSKYLNRMRVGASYNEFKTNLENVLMNIPEVGEKMAKGLKKSKDSIKGLFVQGSFVEEMGITYIGPVDGHNIKEMTKTFRKAFRLNKPILVHVRTTKGAGYKYAEKYPEHFHGVDPFDIETGISLTRKTRATYTDVFGKKLRTLGEENEKIVAITAAMAHGTGVSYFQKSFPERTFDVGIAEQHAVTFAAGLAAGGFIPVVAIYSSFLQRAYDQILHDVCLQGLHVIFAIDRSGIVGRDGETHQGIYDDAYLADMPGLIVIEPKNAFELSAAFDLAVSCDGPVAIKYSRGYAYRGLISNEKLEVGKAEIISGCIPESCRSTDKVQTAEAETSNVSEQTEKKRVALFACGNMVEEAVKCCDKLISQAGIEPLFVNARFIKPLDETMLRNITGKFDIIAFAEETCEAGSFGERAVVIIQDELSKLLTGEKYELGSTKEDIRIPKVINFCIKEETVPQGSVDELRDQLGISADKMAETIMNSL
ncbi:MAG: 1-deoxy-D-xylulose-5-phosphate synthase [Eubacterium sp.]|nr:1-deoxy-D-xylulose-5-phosphate synthase [Eubacterium sp.]